MTFPYLHEGNFHEIYNSFFSYQKMKALTRNEKQSLVN